MATDEVCGFTEWAADHDGFLCVFYERGVRWQKKPAKPRRPRGGDDGFANLQLIYMQLGYFQMHMGET